MIISNDIISPVIIQYRPALNSCSCDYNMTISGMYYPQKASTYAELTASHFLKSELGKKR